MLVIVRHGNTFEVGEAPRRIGANTDLKLTQTGEAQAAVLGAHFKALGWHFTRALVSPLLRTQQTAEAILAAQPSPPRPENADFLREIDHGPDENRSESEVLARIGPEALLAWDTCATTPPGWRVDAPERISAWQDLFAELKCGEPPVLLVTSNGAARFALLADPSLQQSTMKLPTGSYGVIARMPSGKLAAPIWGRRP